MWLQKQSLLISSLDLTVYATCGLWTTNHTNRTMAALIVSKLLLLSRLLPYAVTLSTVVKYQAYKSLEINFYRRLYLLPKYSSKGLVTCIPHWLRKAAKNITSFFGAVRILYMVWLSSCYTCLSFLLFHSLSLTWKRPGSRPMELKVLWNFGSIFRLLGWESWLCN